jgi:Family of unknown function (DUF6345)
MLTMPFSPIVTNTNGLEERDMAEVGVEWINNFPDPCDQNELHYCDETSEGFLAGMLSRGHAANFNWGNANAWERDFRDPAFGGDDNNWIDSVDFAHFSSHGSTNDSNVFRGNFGVENDACRWRSDQARFGNTDLEYLCIDACNSLELTRDVIAVWQNAFHGLRMILAFTDLVSDSYYTAWRGYNFGRRAGNGVRLKTAWLDECYSSWADDNPVVMAAGRSQNSARNRRDNERLGSGFDDIPNNEIAWFAWSWRS